MLVQRAASNQCAEMLLKRIAAVVGQLDGLTDGDATMFAGKLNNFKGKRGHCGDYDPRARRGWGHA